MDETRNTSEPEKDATPQLRGLYKNVKISVKALDIMIIVSVLLIILVVAADLRSPGLTVTFDPRGGTDVASQTQMYGELLDMPEPPVREGYSFTGWYTDHACTIPWDPEQDTIQSDMTLYAGWRSLP